LERVEERVRMGIMGRREEVEPEITRSEIKRTVRKLKEGKAVGGDDIPGEVKIRRGTNRRIYMGEICNKIWRDEE